MRRHLTLLAGAIVSGGAQALLPWLPGQLVVACVALVPLFLVLEGARAATTIAIALAYTATLGEVAIVPWLAPALGRYFALPWTTAALLAVATVALLALLHGAVLGLVLLLRPRRAGAFQVLWYAALWPLWEALRTWLPPHFPGAALGASLDGAPALLQLASVTGIAGVTAVVVAANAGIAALRARAAHGPQRRACATGVGLLLVALAWGALRLGLPSSGATQDVRVLAVDLVATDVAQSTLDALVAATPTDRGQRPDLVLWPESALNLDLARDRGAWRRIADLAATSGATLVTGGLDLALRADGTSERYNALHVVRPGFGLQSYHKRLLVTLAESWPSFLGAPPAALEPVVAGTTLPVLDGGKVRFGALVCFEITDAASARALARDGATLLVNPTNDAWFRGTEAPHLRWARIRAIESGRPVLRVANAGTSALFDALGRSVASSTPAGPVGVLEAVVPRALDAPYVATGEVFLPACAVVVVLGMVLSVRARRRARVAEAVLRDRA